jgi:O-antigen/teichoic acid export membrane protein
VRAVGTSTFASGLAALVALVSNVLISQQLGPSARGEVAFVLQLAYVVTPFLLLGIDQQTLRDESRREMTRLTRHLVPISFLLTVVFLLVFRNWNALAPSIALTGAWLAIRRNESLRDHSYTRYIKAYIAYQAAIAVCVTVLFVKGNDIWQWWLLPYSLPSLFIIVVEIKNCRTRPLHLFSHLNRSSFRFLPATIATIVVMRADRLLMPTLSSISQLGLYAAVATATEPIYWIAQALADHRASRYAPERKITSLVRSLAVDSLLFAVIAALAGVLILTILIPLLGPSFASTRDLVLPLSLAVLALALYRQLLSWCLGGPHPGVVSYIECTTAVFALPCYWVAISAGGALGAAWGSLAVYGFGAVLALIIVILRRGVVQDGAVLRDAKEPQLG